MITIITGVPGMGKTSLLVSILLKNDKSPTARPVYVMGIPDLTIDHLPAPPVDEWTHKVKDVNDSKLELDYYSFPPNSILVVDEAQRVFRARGSSTKPPPHVQALETHRHTGLDIYLLTQKPHLIDSNVRELCGQHIHIRDSLLGRRLYEWPEYNDVNNKSNLESAVKRSFKPPKESFKHYKSSELHTKQPRRIHQVWFYLFGSFAFFIYFSVKAYNNFTKNIEPASPPTSEKLIENKDTKEPQENGFIKVDSPSVEPVVNVSQDIHPYQGFTFTVSGFIQSATKTLVYFDIVKDGLGVHLTDVELSKMGYSINVINSCTVALVYQSAKIFAVCGFSDQTQYAQNIEHKQSGGIGGTRPPDAEPINVPKDTVGLLSATSPASKY